MIAYLDGGRLLADSGLSAYGAAIIAGAAALLGGLLTAGSTLGAEALRRGQDRKRQAERDQRELRQATRLVLAELAEIKGAIQQSAKSRLTWRNDRPLPAFAWREYGPVLAAHLPISSWRWVEMAYQEANRLNWSVMEMNREYKSDGPVAFIEKEWLRQAFRTLHQAMGELEVALGEPRGAFGYTGYASVQELEIGTWEPLPDEMEVHDLDPAT